MVFLTDRRLHPREFAERHPFEVCDHRTGQVIARFSNLTAAFDTAKSIVSNERRNHPQVDVMLNGERLAQWGALPVPEPEEITLP